jgi:hypothetical protein
MGVHQLAAGPVGHRTEHGTTEEDPDESGGSDQAGPQCAHVPLGLDLHHRDADDAEDVAVEEGAARGEEDEFGMKAVEFCAVQSDARSGGDSGVEVHLRYPIGGVGSRIGPHVMWLLPQ